MPTQSQYTPQTVMLDGGLDLITPSITAAPGTMNACYNFERTDRMGYSRCPGYERTDNECNASLAYTNLVYIQHNSVPLDTVVRSAVWIHTDKDKKVLGFIVSIIGTVSPGVNLTVLAITNFSEWNRVLHTIPGVVLDSASGTSFTVVGTHDFNTMYKQLNPAATTAKDLTEARNNYYISMRDTVTTPGNIDSPIIGIHGYKDHVYVVKDLHSVYFTNGNTEIFSNDFLRKHGGGAGNDIRITEIKLISGTYAGGDAVGTIQIYDTGTYTNGAYDLIRPQTTTANVLNLADFPSIVVSDPWGAGLWRSNSYQQSLEPGGVFGWEPIDQGYILDFNNGTKWGPPHLARRGKFSNYTTEVSSSTNYATVGTTTNTTTGTWNLVGAATVVDAVDNPTGVRVFARDTMSYSSPVTSGGSIDLSSFTSLYDVSTDAGIHVKGLEVAYRMLVGSVPAFGGALSMQTTINTSGTPITDADVKNTDLPYNIFNPAPTLTEFAVGGPEDTWGLGADGLKAVLNNTFGLSTLPSIVPYDPGRSNDGSTLFCEINATLYFTQDITNYYFWNGTDDVIASITNYFVVSGDWDTQDAAGHLQITDIIPVGTADRRYISIGDEIRTSPGGAGLLVATVTTNMVANHLETLADIEAANSRYQFITANFYADEESNAIYGVSGAGRAFSYDGFYFTKIFTQDDLTKDMPRHVANHQFHLVLGYPTGAALLSVTGNPLDFNGVLGATEIDTGDQITGFARMPGTTLGIFCKNSIQGLVGTSADNFSLAILSPYEGALEYHVINMGSKVVYCSYRGLSIFDQTAAYGDFSGQRLSESISPWLLPRIQGTGSSLGTNQSAICGPLVFVASRTKNQLRMYFKDGVRLTMTLVGIDQQPQFTIQAESIYNSNGTFNSFLIPRAEASIVDGNGAERIYISHYSDATPLTSTKYYLYEYDKSWSFDGLGIPAYFVSNENFYGSAFDIEKFEKIRLHGSSLGYAPIFLHVESNYKDNMDNNQNLNTIAPISLPRIPASNLGTDYSNTTNIANTAKDGRSFNFRFISYNLTNTPVTSLYPLYMDVSPPFTLQGLLVQTKEGKGDI